MAYLFSREQTIRILEEMHENYKKWEEHLKETRIYGDSIENGELSHNLEYCEGIIAGVASALAIVSIQDPFRK